MKILVTGFEPFGGNTSNPSAMAAGLLPDCIAGADIIKRILPVVFERAADQLIDFIHGYSPDAVVCTGLAGGRKAITPELIAVNLKNARIPDNEGQQPEWEKILPGGEDRLFTSLPVKEMTGAMAIKEIPAEISCNAGTFVCNEVMYRLLACRNKEHPGMMAGFIHVPFATEYLSYGNDAFSLPIQQIAEALEICVREVVKATYGADKAL